MTVTDQPVVTDLPCVCGCAKWDHKQGRAVCKQCTCERYEPDTTTELTKLRAEVEHLRVYNAELRETLAGPTESELAAENERLRGVNVELGRTQGEIRRLERDNAALVAERDEARATATALGNQLQAAGDLARKLGRSASENKRLHGAATVLAGERDEAERLAKAAQNAAAEMRVQRDAANADRDEARQQAKDAAYAAGQARKGVIQLRQQIADAEAALVEAHKGQRLSNAEHLHQRLSAAALVIGRFDDWRFCPQCRHLDYLDAEHRCGPLIPVDVIVARRPNPPTTEEQP